MTTNTTVSTVSILGKDQIIIGYDIFDDVVDRTLKQVPAQTYVLVTDSNIASFGDVGELRKKFESRLDPKTQRLLVYTIPPGELSKTRRTKEQVEDFMFANKCTRECVLLAVGGGVLGDMIGYVAATFMRGVKYVQIPTTLLAMVDSSIGGKTAVDTPAGKNLVGAFWQPSLNFIELKFLETLPRRELLNGMAEVVKTAAIWNADEFLRLEKFNASFMKVISAPRYKGRADLASIRTDLLLTVQGSVKVKAEVVTLDEREGGLRNILNFGHSIGHAYEALLAPHALHGECVSVGCVLEAELSRYLGHLAPPAVARLSSCLKSYELPVTVKELTTTRARGIDLPVDKLLDLMAVDKKNIGTIKRVTLLSRIGKTVEPHASSVSDEDLQVILSEDVAVKASSKIPKQVSIIPPGSKSISNRVLILCALAKGSCRVHNLLHSDDTGYMIDALQTLGLAKVSLENSAENKSEETLLVEGSGGSEPFAPAANTELYLGNAGTAARFLTALCTLSTEPLTLTGNSRMQERPIGDLVNALTKNGAEVQYLRNQGSLPVRVGKTPFRGGRIELEATVSSQYVSALLMVAPYASEPVTLALVGGQPVSQFYIDMTIQMMQDFGVKVERASEPHTYVIPNTPYTAPADYTVESDASSSTYPLAFAALNGIECTVPSIGSSSLQGDAQFGPLVLERMGCVVKQTATATTVCAPESGKQKLTGIEVDMEPMTDAFMTACVVAACADGSTVITGIANQRVKECDRIHAMYVELAKFGVETEEMPDGIIIHGSSDRSRLRRPVEPIHSYDDHRIAMSLSLLATQIPEPTIIDERKCVSKTWPGWWDILHTTLGIQLEGHSLKVPGVSSPRRSRYVSGRSIVLIGMRGAGKTTLGRAAAEYLKFQFVDLDDKLEAEAKQTIPQIVAAEGWPAFRQLEASQLKDALKIHASGYVIACGGGVIETPECCDALKKFSSSGGFVVRVQRSLAEIKDMLANDTSRPALDAEFSAVYSRRERLYIENSDALLWQPNKRDPREVPKLLPPLLYDHAVPDPNTRSWFVSLTAPDLHAIKLAETCDGCSAVELRVDLLASQAPDFVADQVSYLRLECGLPIIFTVRSQSQGGKFLDADDDGYIALITLAFRMKVEYIDIELTREEAVPVVNKFRGGVTRVIASNHDPLGKWSWRGPEWYTCFFHGSRLGDIVKLVGLAKTFDDNVALDEFRAAISASNVPFIGLNMGERGRMSRLTNKFLTPVTHPSLPSSAAPGQLSVHEINTVLSLAGAIPQLIFFIAGNPVSKSPSPDFHNSLFKNFGFSHQYNRLETDNWEVLKESVDQLRDRFGGASVTIPLKQDALSLCNEISVDAKAIGAVNTLTRLQNGDIRGDNTDWIGIRKSYELNGVFGGDSALIFGAGGTACAAIYAFYKMGFKKVYILNRTFSRAEELVHRFASLDIELEALTAGDDISDVRTKVVFSCVPGQAVDDDLFASANSVLANNNGVYLDASYIPAVTNIMSFAQDSNWHIVYGRTMLRLQGIEQFFLWTGVRSTFSASQLLPDEEPEVIEPKVIEPTKSHSSKKNIGYRQR